MNRFDEIRKAHNFNQGTDDPYFMDWSFTPIEYAAWQDIRGSGLPMLPQVPVLKYFIDFGDPVKKIGIECDGKAWHDPIKDKKRDKQLSEVGWKIFRIPGHVCKRILTDPWELDKDDPHFDKKVHAWFTNTSTGVVYSIRQAYYKDELSKWAENHYDSFHMALDLYRSV